MKQQSLALADVKNPAELQALKDAREALEVRLNSTRHFRENVYRYLSNSACDLRHHIMEPQTLEKGCRLDNSRRQLSKGLEGAGSRGYFVKLPLELLEMIFIHHMDLATLTTSRCASRGMRAMISALPAYHAIIKYAPASLRACLSLQSAPWTTCFDLFRALCSSECAGGCGAFGAFLYVPRCERVCYYCFTMNTKWQLMPVPFVKAHFGVKSEQIQNLPIFRTVPGFYRNRRARHISQRFNCVDAKDLMALIYPTLEYGIQVGRDIGDSSFDHPTTEWPMLDYQKARRAEYRIKKWNYVLTPEHVRSPRWPRMPSYLCRWDGRSNNPWRRYGIVAFPSLDRKERTLDWGVACTACSLDLNNMNWNYPLPQQERARRACRRKGQTLYSKDDFLWHIVRCKKAKAKLEELTRDGDDPEERIDGELCRMQFEPVRHARICRVAGDKAMRLAQAQSTRPGWTLKGSSGPCFSWYGRSRR